MTSRFSGYVASPMVQPSPVSPISKDNRWRTIGAPDGPVSGRSTASSALFSNDATTSQFLTRAPATATAVRSTLRRSE